MTRGGPGPSLAAGLRMPGGDGGLRSASFPSWVVAAPRTHPLGDLHQKMALYREMGVARHPQQRRDIQCQPGESEEDTDA